MISPWWLIPAVGVGFAASKLHSAIPQQGSRQTRNVAGSLLDAERTIHGLRPVLVPLSEGRRVSIPDIVRALT